jgi:hypothetical protein
LSLIINGSFKQITQKLAKSYRFLSPPPPNIILKMICVKKTSHFYRFHLNKKLSAAHNLVISSAQLKKISLAAQLKYRDFRAALLEARA